MSGWLLQYDLLWGMGKSEQPMAELCVVWQTLAPKPWLLAVCTDSWAVYQNLTLNGKRESRTMAYIRNASLGTCDVATNVRMAREPELQLSV